MNLDSAKHQNTKPTHQAAPFVVLHSDDSLLIINKQAGISSTPRNDSPEAQAALDNVESIVRLTFPNARCVHRLDNETTGALVIAKTETEFLRLRDLWNTQSVSKQYRALVLSPTASHLPSRIATPIAHHPKSNKKMIALTEDLLSKVVSARQVKDKARPALTEILDTSPVQNIPSVGLVSDICLRIHTGLRHQIRVHLSATGHEILGDSVYSRYDSPVRSGPLCLHAWKITLQTQSGLELIVTAPLPDDWRLRPQFLSN